MPLIGLLMATEKQVVLGHLHMRPLQEVGSNYEGIRTDPPVGFQFHQLPVRSLDRSGATKSRRWLTLQ